MGGTAYLVTLITVSCSEHFGLLLAHLFLMSYCSTINLFTEILCTIYLYIYVLCPMVLYKRFKQMKAYSFHISFIPSRAG